jgi:putative phage-type endonuclease
VTAGPAADHMVALMTAGEVTADPAGWHAARRRGITASEIGSVMGIPTAYGTPSTVFWDKVDPEPGRDSIRLRVGHHMEPFIAAELFRDDPGLHLFDGGLYAAAGRPWMMATFDRLGARCGRAGGPRTCGHAGYAAPPAGLAVMPVQMKTANSREGWGEPPDGAIPGHYLAQVAWEMAVSGAAEAVLPCLIMPGGPLLVYRVQRDGELEADIAAMIAAGEDMLRRVADYDPPPVDWRPETTAALRRVYAEVTETRVTIPGELAKRYRAAQRARRLAAQRLGQAENEIRFRLGGALTAVTGKGDAETVVAKRSVYTPRRLNLERLRREAPLTAAEYTEPGGQVDKLLPK